MKHAPQLFSSIVTAIALALSAAAAEESGKNASPEKQKGEIKLKVVSPEEYREFIAKQKGKIVVVDFWATWCIPCIKNFSKTVEWSRKYPDKKLVVVTLSMNDSDPETRADVIEFLKKKEATTLNLISNLGGEEEAMQAFDISGGALPHFKIYDRKGNLAQTFGGDPENPFKHDEVEAAFVKLLNQK